MTERVEVYWCLEEPLVSDFPRVPAHILTAHLRAFLDLEYRFGTPLQDEVKSPPLSPLSTRIRNVMGQVNE